MRTLHGRFGARGARASRRGVALFLFALLVFVFLGLAALTVDVGMASVSQAQMQAAVDTAALEGVRLRDFHEYRRFSDIYRRPRVSELVQEVMDDDLHPTGGIDPTGGGAQSPDPLGPGPQGPDDADALRTGAGPLYHVRGTGPDNAGALTSVPDFAALAAADRYVDDPALRFNRHNERHGDMLSGTFHVGIQPHEPSDYDRLDFTRALNFGEAESWMSIGFLVRMRRSDRPNPYDDVPGISSRGPAIPLLFGLGSTIHRTDFYNPRAEGLTARATAIAVGRPALSVGPPPLSPSGDPILDRIGYPMRGVGWWHSVTAGTETVRRHAVVAIDSEFWRLGLENMHDTLAGFQVNPNGHIQIEQYPGVVRDVGRLLVAPCTISAETPSCVGQVATTVGLDVDVDLSAPPYSLSPEEVRAIIDQMPLTLSALQAYLPIYKSIVGSDGAHNRIVGFAFGKLAPGTSSGVFDLSKGWPGGADTAEEGRTIVAPDNASATLSHDAPTLTPAVWTAVLGANIDFAYPLGNTSYRWQNVAPGTLLAPALVR